MNRVTAVAVFAILGGVTYPLALANSQAPPSSKTPRILVEAVLPFTVPFEVWEGLLVIDAGIGSGRNQRAVLHTGLPHTVVTASLAHNRGLKAGETQQLPTLYGPMRTEAATIPLLRLGTLSFADIPARIGDLLRHHTGKSITDAPEIWLGASTLQLAAVTFDPAAGAVVFSKPLSAVPKGATVVPFELKDGRIVVEAKAGGKRFPAVVDTASVSTLVPPEAGKAIAKNSPVTQPIRHPNGKSALAGLLQLKEISIGKLKVAPVSALYLAGGDSGGMDPALGAIGTDILLRYRVTIDYAGKRLVFEKPLPTP